MAFSLMLPVPVVLVPVPPIKRSTFLSHTSLIRVFSRIPLADIPMASAAREEGAVFIEFHGSDYTSQQQALDGHPLRERPLAVIGVVDCSEWDDLAGATAEFENICERHAVLATRCYGFDPKDGQKETEGVITIPSVGDRHFYVGTLVADLVASVLGELESLVCAAPRSYRDALLLTQQTHKVTSFDRPLSLVVQPPSATTQAISLRDPLSESPSRTTSPLPLPGSIHDSIRATLTSTPSHSAPKASARRVAGRQAKIRADIRLMGGRWNEAVELFNDAINTTKASGDNVWQAAALEGLVTVQILQAWSSSTNVRSTARLLCAH
jgi:hypothetical protein